MISEELTRLFAKLAGSSPTETDIIALSNKGRKEWVKIIGLNPNGLSEVIKKRFIDHFIPASPAPPPVVRSSSSKRQRVPVTRSDSEDASEEAEVVDESD